MKLTRPVTKQPEMRWTGQRWHCKAEIALRSWELARICDYMIGVQAQRRLGLPPGELRDDLDRSVLALRARRVDSVVTGEDVFKSTEATGKIISLGGAA